MEAEIRGCAFSCGMLYFWGYMLASQQVDKGFALNLDLLALDFNNLIPQSQAEL